MLRPVECEERQTRAAGIGAFMSQANDNEVCLSNDDTCASRPSLSPPASYVHSGCSCCGQIKMQLRQAAEIPKKKH